MERPLNFHRDMDLASFQASATEAVRLLRSMANRNRLMVLCELGAGERSVGQLVAAVGLGQSALSQHLAKLRAEGLVATRREAQTIHYRLASPAVVAVIGTLAAIFCPPPKRKKEKRA